MDTGWVQIMTIRSLKLIYMQTAMSRTRNGMMDGILFGTNRDDVIFASSFATPVVMVKIQRYIRRNKQSIYRIVKRSGLVGYRNC